MFVKLSWLDRRIGEAWDRYAEWSQSWIVFDEANDDQSILDVYGTLLGGRPDPRVGHICSLSSKESS